MATSPHRAASRRRFLMGLAAAALSGLAAACGRVLPGEPGEPAGKSAAPSTLPPSADVPAGTVGAGARRRVDPETGMSITPNEDFYTVAYFTGPPPRVDPSSYRLGIHGLVERELSLALDELKTRPAVREMRTLECISNPAGGNLISNAWWRGVRLPDLLDEAGVKADAVELKLVAADGYHTSIPLEVARDPHSLLVYEMNGLDLPVEHGFPLRCLWPGRYGQKQPKWLTEIELVGRPHLGYWEQQGWSNEARVKVNSRIEAPESGATLEEGQPRAAGVAFSGLAGLGRVELSPDDQRTWLEARLKQHSPLVWTEWESDWPATEGSHVLVARATNHSGVTQERKAHSFLSGTFPTGTSDMHWLRVAVEKARSLARRSRG